MATFGSAAYIRKLFIPCLKWVLVNGALVKNTELLNYLGGKGHSFEEIETFLINNACTMQDVGGSLNPLCYAILYGFADVAEILRQEGSDPARLA